MSGVLIMSRIGKKPITIPSAVTLTQDGQKITARGPKGELNFTLPEGVTGKIEGDVFTVNPLSAQQVRCILVGHVPHNGGQPH